MARAGAPVPHPSRPGISFLFSNETAIIAVVGSIVKIFDFVPLDL